MAKQRSRTLTRVKGIESPDFEKSDHLSVLHETEMGLWDFGRETAGQQVGCTRNERHSLFGFPIKVRSREGDIHLPVGQDNTLKQPVSQNRYRSALRPVNSLANTLRCACYSQVPTDAFCSQ